MKFFCASFLTLAAILPLFGAPPIVSTFATGPEGWTAPVSAGVPGSGLSWNSTGYAVLTASPYMSSSSTPYGGDRSTSYGAQISFRMTLFSQTASGQGRIRLTGGSNPPYLEWYFNMPTTPQGWQTFGTTLASGQGWVVLEATPRAATEAEIRAVLANLSIIQILFPPEMWVGVDDVSLGVLDPTPPPAVPLPPAAVLTLTGLGGAALFELRRRWRRA